MPGAGVADEVPRLFEGLLLKLGILLLLLLLLQLALSYEQACMQSGRLCHGTTVSTYTAPLSEDKRCRSRQYVN
jgi:hypothetical protein